MQSLRYFLIFIILICGRCSAQEAFCPEILSYIKQELTQYGILKNSGGFIYVDIDDEYIHKLVTFIQQEGFEEPPYFGNADLVGAHITVVYPSEVNQYGIGKIEECGEIIYFTPKECKIVIPPKWSNVKEVYFVVVESPEIERIRQKYGLPKREYDFHITIGVKTK